MKNKALNLPYKLLIILSIFAILPACSSSDDDDDASNSAPSVSAGEDQTVNQGATVDLVGVASDSDGSISSWLWKQTSGSHSVTIKNSTTSNAYFSAPTVDTETTLVFELEVKDNNGASVSDSMRVTVLGSGDSVNPLPDNFEAEAGDGQVTLTWTHHSGATYNIYRSSDPNCELANYTTCTYGALFTSKSSGFVDDDLTNGTNYYYWIEAILDGFTYLDEEAVNATPEDGEDNIDLTDGLVAHYEFDGDADDSSGNGNDGEEFGGVSYTDGVIGRAASFDGVDDFIELNEAMSSEYLGLSVWFNTDSTKTGQDYALQIIRLRYYGYGIKLNSPDVGMLSVNVALSASENLLFESDSTSFNDGNWYHLVVNYSDVGLRIYIDNNLIHTHSTTNSQPIYHNPDGGYSIGKDGNHWTDYFEGSIDDFRIYNRALSVAEIEALYELDGINSTGKFYGDFAITDSAYEDDYDWDEAIQAELGDSYRVADWNDLKDYYNGGGDILALFDGIGITEYDSAAFVTRDGDKSYSSTRYYFASRHEGQLPTTYSYLAHDNIGNYLISLGSWYTTMKIIAIKR